MFSKKSPEERQKELDADFLKAVRGHDFGKAKKLLRKGADILAKDAEDNTALHKLAANAHVAEKNQVDEFVCFLLNQKVDINARNKQGRTCLHEAAANEKAPYYYRCSPTNLVSILLNRGADPDAADAEGKTPLFYAAVTEREGSQKTEVIIEIDAHLGAKDNLGQTVLHVAAANGRDDVVNLLVGAQPALVAVQDNEGKYPYQSAIAAAAGHHALSRELFAKLNEYNEEKTPGRRAKHVGEEITEPDPEIQPLSEILPATSIVSAANDDWVLLNPKQVEHTEKTSSYRLTHIFNFSARTYTHITHNLETKADVVETKSFDDFADKTPFEEAHRELTRLGGKVDENVIHGRVIAKELKPPRA